ncbi:RhuM family protein [Photobacterium phosphoreum]|uniref:RhuM family protein n=1 Tax=Photobacterium phosphoreum TaxID=659 RepID=UPI0034D215CE
MIPMNCSATQLIKEYIIKGFAMDDDRLKNGRYFGKDYFRELLDRTAQLFHDEKFCRKCE